jgi:hypothetical protein
MYEHLKGSFIHTIQYLCTLLRNKSVNANVVHKIFLKATNFNKVQTVAAVNLN